MFVEPTIPANEERREHANADAILIAKNSYATLTQPLFGRLEVSKVFSVLGPESFAEVACVKVPGKVIWCNFELATELGFDVPRSNRMTQQFHEQLMEALAYRILERGEGVGDRNTIKLYADSYGGDGVSPALGAGRAAFLPYGNLYVKGIGLTPLFRHDDPDDFEHSHGGIPMDEAIAEALFGEVNANLFTRGSARILAIIDHHEFIIYPEGHKVPRCLVVRAGTQVRPAHLLAHRIRRHDAKLEVFIRMTRETGQLIMRANPSPGQQSADLKATMLSIIDDHARTAAEQFRWRIIHGALSPSNMELSGAMLDLATQTAQPRTAPIYVLPYPDSTYGREHIERVNQLRPIYRALVRSIPPSQRESLNAKPVNFVVEMNKAYAKHLQVKLLGAIGLKREVAERIQTDHTETTRRFADVIVNMAQLKNRGCVNAGRTPVAAVSVLDIFHLFSTFPAAYFAAPRANHTARILDNLKPIFKGNRFHIANKQNVVIALVKEFAGAYREIMDACEALSAEFYDDKMSMRDSIKARAAFENEPLSLLYRANVYKEFKSVVSAYRRSGDEAVFGEFIDRKVAASLRRVDALLFQGSSRLMRDGSLEIERRTIDGVNYSVRCWNDEKQTRRLHISLSVEREDDRYVTVLPGDPRLCVREINSLRYHFTTDAGKTHGKVGARLSRDEQGCPIIDFADIAKFPLAGLLAGFLSIRRRSQHGSGHRVITLREYPFAIPDNRELTRMAERLRAV
jgi:hypothetical protein